MEEARALQEKMECEKKALQASVKKATSLNKLKIMLIKRKNMVRRREMGCSG